MRVKGTIDQPTRGLIDGKIHVDAIDLVRWAPFARVKLDRNAFIKQWRRYVALLDDRIKHMPNSCVLLENLTQTSQRLAQEVLQRIGQVEFIVSSTEDACIAMILYTNGSLTPWITFLEAGLVFREEP